MGFLQRLSALNEAMSSVLDLLREKRLPKLRGSYPSLHEQWVEFHSAGLGPLLRASLTPVPPPPGRG